MFGLLLKDGTMQCPKCNHGTFTDYRGSQHVCRVCKGTGAIPIKQQVQDVIGRLRLVIKRLPIVSTEHSTILRFTSVEDCTLIYEALRYQRMKPLIILENNPINIKGKLTRPAPLLLHELANTT